MLAPPSDVTSPPKVADVEVMLVSVGEVTVGDAWAALKVDTGEVYAVPTEFVAKATKEYAELGVRPVTASEKVPVEALESSTSVTPVPPKLGFALTEVRL
jgi:hypothetical protein